MLTHFLRFGCVAMLFVIAQPTLADVYKWQDENGQTHYSQTPPSHQDADVVTTQTGPTVTPVQSQQAVEQLIQEQRQAEEAREEQQQRATAEKERAEIKAKNCRIAKDNLQQYLDNPNTRILQDDGSVVRIDEQERQRRIKEQRLQIKTLCQ